MEIKKVNNSDINIINQAVSVGVLCSIDRIGEKSKWVCVFFCLANIHWKSYWHNESTTQPFCYLFDSYYSNSFDALLINRTITNGHRLTIHKSVRCRWFSCECSLSRGAIVLIIIGKYFKCMIYQQNGITVDVISKWVWCSSINFLRFLHSPFDNIPFIVMISNSSFCWNEKQKFAVFFSAAGYVNVY